MVILLVLSHVWDNNLKNSPSTPRRGWPVLRSIHHVGDTLASFSHFSIGCLVYQKVFHSFLDEWIHLHWYLDCVRLAATYFCSNDRIIDATLKTMPSGKRICGNLVKIGWKCFSIAITHYEPLAQVLDSDFLLWIGYYGWLAERSSSMNLMGIINMFIMYSHDVINKTVLSVEN